MDQSMEDINFLKAFPISSVTTKLTLEEQENFANELLREISKKSANATNNDYALPVHLENFRKQYEQAEKKAIKLPGIISQLTPRSRKKLSQLPPPNKHERQAVKKIEEFSKGIEPGSIYDHIERAPLHNAADTEDQAKLEFLDHVGTSAVLLQPRGNTAGVDKSSTEYYESIGQSVKRKQEQAVRIANLFDDISFGGTHSNSHRQASKATTGHGIAAVKKAKKSTAVTSSSSSSVKGSAPPRLRPIVSYSSTSELSRYLSEKSTTMGLQSLPQQQPQLIQLRNRSAESGTADNSRAVLLLGSASEKVLPGRARIQPSQSQQKHQQHHQQHQQSVHTGQEVVPSIASIEGSAVAQPNHSEAEHAVITPLTTRESPHLMARPKIIAPPALHSPRMSLQHAYAHVLQETEERFSAVVDQYSKQKELQARDAARLKARTTEKEYLNQFSVGVYEEIGLDINREYIRLRKFKSYIKLLLFYVYSFRTRAAFVHYKEQIRQMRLAMLRRMAQRVYCAVRSAITWRAIAARERLRRQQLNSMAESDRELRRRMNESSNRIRNSVRRYARMKVVRRRLAQRRAATLLQKRVRGMIGRRIARAVLERFRFIFRTARAIQMAYRRRLATRKVTLARKLDFVHKWLAHVQSRRAATQQSFYIDGAESFIAKAFRTHVIRKRLGKLVYWNHFAKAGVIQRVYRGFRARKVTTKAIQAKRGRRALELVSALHIQRYARGHFARKRFWQLVKQRKVKQKQRYELKLRKMRRINVKKLTPLALVSALAYKLKPFKHIRLNRKATQIQRIWRGHHGRVRAFIVRVQYAIAAINKRFRQRTKAAIKIQKVYRGWKQRDTIRKHKCARLTVRIQCIWRLHKAFRKVRRLKTLNENASILTKLLFRLCKRHKFRVKYRRLMRLKRYVIRIQCFARRCMACARVGRLKARLRSDCELSEFLDSRGNDVYSAVQLRILVDTMTRTMGQKYMSQCFLGAECLCFGPLQAIFVLAVCGKGKTDSLLLGTNRVDANSLVKFLMRVNDLMVNGAEASSKIMLARRSKSIGTLHRTLLRGQFQLALLDRIDRGLWVLPQGRAKLTPNEVDIVFSKSITNHSAGNVLSYAEFLECLYKIAKVHYVDRTVSLQASMLLMDDSSSTGDGEYDPSKVVTLESSSSTRTTPAGTTELSSASSRPASPVALQSDIASLKARAKGTVQRALNGKKTLSLAQLRYDPHALLSGPSPDLRLAMVLNMLLSFRDEPWLLPILAWLDCESKARVGVFVTRIQNMVRIRQARSVKGLLQQKKEATEALLRQAKFAVRLQAVVRRLVHRNRVARLAQRTIVQYTPHLGEPYWYNPKTQAKTWVKPKVLRNLACYSLALPEEGLENVISCCYCTSAAEVNCADCEDSMCKICYNSMHCKGNRRRHRSEKIPMCSFCKYQVATKSCLTCILTTPPKSSIKHTMKQSERGTYCDTCFTHEHDLNEHALETQSERRKGIKIMLNYSHEAYLVRQYIHQPIRTNHKYDQLVQPCEECRCRSSAWRCLDCQQVYCNKCLIGLHSMGGAFSRHTAELLPYYTPAMHKSLQKDFNAQNVQRKMEKLSRVAAAQREETAYRSAVKLQAWWRMYYHGRLGRKTMRKRRKLKRIAFRARKRETAEVRSSLAYRIADVFSLAPPLRSDTVEEAALRRVNIFYRQRAREYIWRNKDDWGYYRVSSSVPRKGVPHTGFKVGTLSELSDQALRGGYRMPGRVMVVPNERNFDTTCDLTKFVRPGELVRIRARIFGVVKVTSDSLKLNRNWRGDEPEHGEVVYRVPTYRNERDRLGYRLRYITYDLTVNNPLAQAFFFTCRAFNQRMVRYSIYMMNMNRKSGAHEDAAEWRKTAEAYADNARWASAYLASGDAVVDLSTIDRADEEDEDARHRARRGRRARANSISDSDDGGGFSDDGEDEHELDEFGELQPRSKGSRRKPSSRGSKRSGRSRRAVHVGDGFDEEGGDDGDGFYSGDEYSDGEGSQDGDFSERDSLNKGEDRKRPSSRSTSDSNRPGSSAGGRGGGRNRPSSRDNQRPNSRGNDNGNASGQTVQIAQKRTRGKKRIKDTGRAPGEQWYATIEETLARREREDKMTPLELSLEAGEWKECVDIMTENTYFLNIHTNEMMTTVPRSVAARRQMEFENSRNKRNYDEAQRRIQRFEMVTKNRLLITGGRKK